VLEALGAAGFRGRTWLTSGVSSAVVKGLVDEGVLEVIEIEAEAAFDRTGPLQTMPRRG